MSRKEITGFKPRYYNTSDGICPNCEHKQWFHLSGYEGIFKSKLYNYYTCSECGCQWKVRRN